MNLEYLINKIIPPADYNHRNGFSNTLIIDQLNVSEKKQVEDVLINKLLNRTDDLLVVETLAYMKSEKSLSILYNMLSNNNETAKLIIATSIFEINSDENMVDISIESVKKIDNIKDPYYIHKLTSAFYCLSKFKNDKTTQLLREYSSNPEYLISYNAKQALANDSISS